MADISISTSRRRSQTKSPRLLGALAILAVSSTALPAWAQDEAAFFVPDATVMDQADTALRAVSVADSKSAKSCELVANICHCVVSDNAVIETLRADSAEGVSLRVANLQVVAERWTAAEGFEGITIVRGEEAFEAETARRSESGWQFAGLRWGKAEAPIQAACGAEAPSVETSATGEGAITTAGEATIEGLTVGFVPYGTVSSGASSSGLTPPSFRASADAVEFEASGYVAPLGSLVAVAAPGDWYGGGVRIHSQRGGLDLQGRYDQETGGFEPFAWGAATFGSERQRIDVQLEHPSRQKHADLRLLESDAFLRGFRRSSMGANLSGRSYGLRMDSTWITDSSGMTGADLAANFGARSEVVSFLELDLDLDHRSVVVADESTHSSTASARLRAPIGSRSKVWAAPSLGMFTNYGVLPTNLGFEASSSGGLFAIMDAGASWSGSFPSVRHRFSPRLQVGRELFGIEQRAPLPADAAEYLFTRVEQAHWGVLTAENSFTLARSVLTVTPAAVLLGAGVDLGELAPAADGQLEFEHVEFGGSVVCRSECGEFAARAGASVFGARWRLGTSAAHAAPADISVLSLLRSLDSPNAPILVSRELATDRMTIVHAHGSWSVGEFTFETSTAATDESWSGAYGGASWHPMGSGWSWRLLGGWNDDRDAWNVALALRIL